MGWIAGADAERGRQHRGRWRRRLLRRPPTIHYFHQVDDPHSHLAVQTLDALASTYAVDLRPHPVPGPGPGPGFLGDQARQPRRALVDARDIAPFHGLEPPSAGEPDQDAFAAIAGLDASSLTLEVFPSLRSPYTAVSPSSIRWTPSANRSGAPCPSGHRFTKRVTARPSLTPISMPPGSRAWTSPGMRACWKSCADPEELAALIGGDVSTALLEENLDAMLEADLWGVPAFRVSGGGAPALAFWGQDRLWRVEAEIVRRASSVLPSTEPASTRSGDHP